MLFQQALIEFEVARRAVADHEKTHPELGSTKTLQELKRRQDLALTNLICTTAESNADLILKIHLLIKFQHPLLSEDARSLIDSILLDLETNQKRGEPRRERPAKALQNNGKVSGASVDLILDERQATDERLFQNIEALKLADLQLKLWTDRTKRISKLASAEAQGYFEYITTQPCFEGERNPEMWTDAAISSAMKFELAALFAEREEARENLEIAISIVSNSPAVSVTAAEAKIQILRTQSVAAFAGNFEEEDI
jgi:hypothetical protein